MSNKKPLKITPKMELIVTLDKVSELLREAPSELNRALVYGAIDHARALAKRVGHEARRPGKAKPAQAVSA